MTGYRVSAVMLGFLILGLALPAAGHQLRLFAVAEGTTLKGTVHWASGKPATSIPVKVYTVSGEPLGETRTDRQGNFAFTITQRADYLLVADAGGGHQAEFTISVQEISTPSNSSSPTTSKSPAIIESQLQPDSAEFQSLLEQAIARQIRPLREELASYEAKIRWHDVLGGIGYLLGLFGIACYLLSRRQSPPD